MKKFLFSFALLLSAACQAQSVCYGTPANGALSRSVQLQDGENFEVYRWLEGRRRLFVHIDVQKILIEAFDELQKTAPGAQFVIGEASFQGGGLSLNVKRIWNNNFTFSNINPHFIFDNFNIGFTFKN
jgi:penicillin-insensitive murein endopeptidase